MSFFQFTPRSPGGKPRRARLPIRPVLEALEDRLTPTGSITVTNLADTGANTLRDAVMNADNNTTGVYTINLTAGTYTLSQADPLSLNNNRPGTTIVLEGATDPTTGEPATTIDETAASRVLQVFAQTNVILENVKITGGKALDDGGTGLGGSLGGGLLSAGTVALTNVTVSGNSAVGAPGSGAFGGGIYSINGTLSLDDVTVSNNQAVGGNGKAGQDGGGGFGGGVYEVNSTVIVTNVRVTPGNPAQTLPPTFDPAVLGTTPLLTVSGNTARGGNGGNGVNVSTAQKAGGMGGFVQAGGLYLTGGTVNLVAASITNNLAAGGQGGSGNSGGAKFVGDGGEGGDVIGGGIGLNQEANTALFVQDSTIAANTAQGGNGGNGGNGDAPGVAGGNGGMGGSILGGGLGDGEENLIISLVDSTVAFNNANAGAGGNGGNGDASAGGNGGDGGQVRGGGLSLGTPTTLDSVTIADNNVNNTNIINNPAAGGTGGLDTTTGGRGNPGAQGPATGGGLDSGNGWATLNNSLVAANSLLAGDTTNAGPDVAGMINTATQFSYFGNANGANLLTDPKLFNAAKQTPMDNNLYGGFNDAQGNMISTDPGLATQLGEDGGPTPTIALQSTSQLIGRGTTGFPGSAFDQRGVTRSGGVDLGAFQHGSQTTTAPTLSALSANPTSVAAGGLLVFSVDVNSSNRPVNEGTVTFSLVNPTTGASVVLDQNVAVQNGLAVDTITLPTTTAAGSYNVVAQYTDAGGSLAGTSATVNNAVTVQAQTTSAAVTGSSTPTTLSQSTSAQQLTVNAAVSNDNAPVLGGIVTFALQDSNGNAVAGASATATTNAQGQTGNVTLPVPANTPAGSYTVQASWTDPSGVTHTANIGSLTIQSTNNSSPTITLLSVASASPQQVTASVGVRTVGGSAAVPEGLVTFTLMDASGGLVALTSANVANGSTGIVSLPLKMSLSPGQYTLQASYSDLFGSKTYSDSSTSQTVTIPAPPVSPPPASSPPAAPPAAPPVPPLQAIIALFIDGAEKILQGDSPALEANISANLPYAVLTGFNIGELALLAGEMAANNALHGGNN